MTIQLGGGSTEDQHTADALLRDSGRNVFVYLYETFAASLFDYCAGLLPDPVAACDAVQDSLVAVDGQISELPDPDQLRLWLYAAARRACQNRLAARGPRPASPAEAAGPDGFGLGAPDGFGLGAPGPAGPDRETLAIVSAALARLDASDREVLNLAYRHGIEGGDLAGVLGLPARRARALLAGACARFAQSASVVEVLRAGPAGCHVAPGIVGSPDPAAPAALRAGPRFSRHVGSCPDCARVLAGRSFEAGLIARVPLEVPVGRLRLRIARTAVALGTYRRKVVDVPDLPGGPFEPGQPAEPARPDPRARRAEPAVPVVPAAPAGLGEADDTGVMAPVRARGAEPAGPAVPAGLGEADDTGVMAPVRARGAEPAGPAVPAGLGEADDTGVMAPVRARGAEPAGPAVPAGLGEADDTGVMAPVRARGAEPAGPAVPAGLGEADDTGVMAPVRARGAEPAGPAVPAGLGEADDTGVPAPVKARRGVPKAMAASSVALAVLAVPGVLFFRHELAVTGPRPLPVREASGLQQPTLAPSPISPELRPAAPGPPHPLPRRVLPAFPLIGPTPLGVLPDPSASQTGASSPSRTSPAPSHSQSPPPKSSPPKSSPPPTTPPPTTPPPSSPPPSSPPPTTPAPTPNPSSTAIG